MGKTGRTLGGLNKFYPRPGAYEYVRLLWSALRIGQSNVANVYDPYAAFDGFAQEVRS